MPDASQGTAKPRWSESFERGDIEAERRLFEKMGQRIMRVQLRLKRKAKAGGIQRAFHSKAVFASTNAFLKFESSLPEEFRTGFAAPGAEHPAIVRFSNASGVGQPDNKADLRGVALRVNVSDSEQHDFLATSYPVSHARNAAQFVAVAEMSAAGFLGRIAGLLGLMLRFGPFETIRILANVSRARRKSTSLALETYWSRGAMRWGPLLAVRFILQPSQNPPPPAYTNTANASFLSREFEARATAGEVSFDLLLQKFVNESATPIENTAKEWRTQAAPAIKVATLTIPRVSGGMAEAQIAARVVDELAFNPWNTTEEFSPLGNLNRARKSVYDASAHHRQAFRWLTQTPLHNLVLGGMARGLFAFINLFIEWHRLPVRLSLINIDGFRFVLRRKNLIDTEVREAPPKARSAPPPVAETLRQVRSYDGTYNDLSDPAMGSVGTTFGRNLAPKYDAGSMDKPNAVVVAKELLHRTTFLPARSLNILAAAWIQFQVHDWVNHARHKLGVKDLNVPMPQGSLWRNSVDGPEESVMRMAGNIELPARNGQPPVYFGNSASHWWDGSEVYGPNRDKANALREVSPSGVPGAKLRLVNNHLPTDIRGSEVTGFNESWWLGLSAMHTLFAREHNLLCDELRRNYPLWDDERVYQTARLIVSALIAKIHTIEWTPAILATKTIDIALNSNWSGPPAEDWTTRLGIWLLDEHALTGIPKTVPDHHAAPYSLTEDFVTVYRMHPLLPDQYSFYDHKTGQGMKERSFMEIQGSRADDVLRENGLRNTLYSFGVAHPGAISLHNYPNSLIGFERDGERIDLSVVDIMRTRARGVPRYNDFRAGLHRPRIRRWEDLTADPESVRKLRQVYKSIDDVDTMVGLFAETPPNGFGFSDTAFRIFILMASRRLQSDRFLNVDFRPEIYSPFGMDWIANNGMTSLILRHCPDLGSMIPRTGSAFAPWRPIVPQTGGGQT